MDTLIQANLQTEETNRGEDTEPPSNYFEEGSSCTIQLPELKISPAYGHELKQEIVSRKLTGITSSERAARFYKEFFPNSLPSDWSDWKWQLKNRITDLATLEKIITLSDDERAALTNNKDSFPFSITPYYASLLEPNNPEQSIRKTVIPSTSEHIVSKGESDDPLSEETDSPVHGLVHRYPDRVLFLTTEFCSVFCRYCTRSRMVGNKGKCNLNISHWQKAIEYIKEHTEIRDVLLSGGDPLTLPNDKLEWLLSNLRAIPHVEVIRIGTKVPTVLPQRITTSLISKLKKYHPLWMSIHFTHPEELTPEVVEACSRLADAGIPLGSQTVLLKGVNDSVDVMRSLMQKLMKARVRPYYLYQCDPITGSAHFRTKVAKGIEIIKGLRGHTSGYAVPHYVIDAPGGGGKIPLLPEYYAGTDECGNVKLNNYEDKQFYYPDVM